jgi:hypothetical protein
MLGSALLRMCNRFWGSHAEQRGTTVLRTQSRCCLQEAIDSGCTAVCCDCVGADYIGDAAGKVWLVGTEPAAGLERAASLTVHGKVQSIHVNGRQMIVSTALGSVRTFTMTDGTWKPQAEVCASLCGCITSPCI